MKPYIKKIKFDYIHHVTLATFRYPSFLSFFNVPFIYGPVAGGETAPILLRKDFTFTEKLIDYFRDLGNLYCKFSPLINLTYLNSYKIFATTKESKKIIPSIYHKKTKVLLAVASNNFKIKKKYHKKKFRICFAGRLLSWKGLHIVLEAYELINKKYKNTSLTIVGDGIIKDILKNKAKLLNIDNSITWTNRIEHKKVLQYFNNSDLIMIPSLRDSGGFVILEAIRCGSVVAVCNLGGPGAIIDNTCGISIDVKNKSQTQIARDMSKSVIKLISDKKKYNSIKKKSHEKIKKLSWKNKIKKVYY